MIEKSYQKLTRRSIAIVLVVAIVFVFVLGDKYWGKKETNNKVKATTESDLTIETKTGNQLRSVDELVLAETDTGVGKISETLQEGYENLEKSYGNEKDFDNAVTVFSNLVSSLKNKTIEELDKTDNGTEEYQDYRTSVLADYKELATYTNELSNGNISRTLRKIKNKVVSEKPFMALGNDLPFENVANDNVTIEKYTAEDVDGYKTENKKYNKVT